MRGVAGSERIGPRNGSFEIEKGDVPSMCGQPDLRDA